MKTILKHIDEAFDESVEHLFEFLRLKSISTDSNYKQDCVKTAEFLVKDLQNIGFDAQMVDMGGHPIVFGVMDGPENSPHFLFYGHYDVQPVDPLGEWEKPPFEPYIRIIDGEEQIVARGASDDKGQLMTFIEACRAYKKVKGGLPCKITILLEGEEESGSTSLVPFLKSYQDKLQADLAFVCDTSMWNKTTPAITVALRGILAQEIIIEAANRDLHSGSFGGVAANPLKILAKILSHLCDDKGSITLENFYQNVEDVPNSVLEQWQKLSVTPESFLGPIGLFVETGEPDRLLLEKLWARPTAEINGLKGGYCGEGFKTVIPSKAQAKISFRLVKGQDPDQVREAFQNFVRSHLPKDCKVHFIDHGGAKAVQLPYDSTYVLKAKEALTNEWHKEALLIASGGSIPVVGDFLEYLNVPSLMVGFGLEDDNIHSPNEKYNIRSFHKGQRSWVRILNALT